MAYLVSSVFGTAEASAWSRDFTYAEYCTILCPQHRVRPVHELVFNKLKEAFNLSLELDAQSKTN